MTNMLNRLSIARRTRRGAALPFTAILLVVLLGMAAFATDIGYVCVVKTQLAAAADSAVLASTAKLLTSQQVALAEAKRVGLQNFAGGQPVVLANSDVTFGNWDSSSRRFQVNGFPTNAVRVVARRPNLRLFFGGVLGRGSTDVAAEAIATVNPRDFAFVVDLSGSMNNDTEIWATAAINGAFPGYPTVGSDLLAAVFQDFGFGGYPGVRQHIGNGIGGTSQDDSAYANLTKNGGYLNNLPSTSPYKINTSDSTTTRKSRAYKWIIDKQLAVIMPAAKPTPNSSTSYAYWEAYLDYIIKPQSGLPPNQNSYQLSGGGNPYQDAWPSLGSNSYSGFYNKVGYLTYVQFMMDYGWNKDVTGSTKVPLSRLSPDCPWRVDNDPASPGYGIRFPPREQPTHAGRLAIMAAIEKMAQVNVGLSEAAKDHVAIISFDVANGTAVRFPLRFAGCDYQAAKLVCRDLQAVADDQISTASEVGLVKAITHLDPALNSDARYNATKTIIFLSDGIPNIKQSSNTTINAYRGANQGEWFSSGSYVYERNAVLMQAAMLNSRGWKLHAVGLGLGADRTLMDRVARMNGTGIQDPNNPGGQKISPYATGNPADYQARLTAIFTDIIRPRAIHLVN